MSDLFDRSTRFEGQSFKNLAFPNIRVESSQFEGCSFYRCNFTESTFTKCRFKECNFRKCNLGLVKLPGTQFSSTRFEDSELIGIDWTEANWPEIQLDTPITFERCALNHSTFFGLKLHQLKLVDCLTHNVDFAEADLTQANLNGSDLEASRFFHTNLSRADLSSAVHYAINANQNLLKGTRFSLPEAISLLYSLDIELVDSSPDRYL